MVVIGKGSYFHSPIIKYDQNLVFIFVFCFEIRDSSDLLKSTVLYTYYDKTDIMYTDIISVTFKQLNIE